MNRIFPNIEVRPEDVVNDFAKPAQAQPSLRELTRSGIFPSKIQRDPGMNDMHRAIISGDLSPFNETNSKFDIVTLLADIGFWRGYMRQRKGVTSKELFVYGDRMNNEIALLVECLTGDRPTFKKNVQFEQEAVAIPGIYSRFLAIFGAILGAKKESSRGVPMHLVEAINTLKKHGVSEEESVKAKGMLRDFILSFFYGGKVRESETRGFSGVIPGSSSLEVAEERRRIFLEALERGDFRLEVKARINKQEQKKDEPSYNTIIQFPHIDEFTVRNLQTECKGRVYEAIKASQES